MTRRIVIALLIALPFALLSIRFADYVGGSHTVEYLISPGSYVGLLVPSTGDISDNLSRFIWTALAVNEVYYGVLVFLVIVLVRLVRHSGDRSTAKSQ